MAEPSAAGRVTRNFLALGSGEAVSRVVAFAATMYLARVLGPDGYGVIALAVGINLYLAKIADFGVEAAGAKEVADSPDGVQHLASAVLTARLCITLAMVIVAGGLALWLVPDPEGPVLALYFLTLIPLAASTRWIHIGLEDARPVAIARTLGEIVSLGLVVLLVRGVESLKLVPLAQGSAELLVAVLLYAVLRRRSLGFGLRWDPRAALPVLKRGFPLVVQVMLGLLIYNSDLVFVRVLKTQADVGYYAAAYTLVSFAANLGMTYGVSLLPTLARVRKEEGGERALYQTALLQTFAVSLPVAVGTYFLAAPIIALGFGQDFGPSSIALQVLAFSIPFSAIRWVPWVATIARGQSNRLTSVMVIGALGNLALNAALVPRWGFPGAGVATVLTEAGVCSLMLHALASEGLAPAAPRRLLKPLLASAAMGAVLYVVAGLNLFASVALGVVVFAGVMTATGAIKIRPGTLPSLEL